MRRLQGESFPASDRFRLEIIRTEEAFAGIQAAWSALCDELQETVTVFASPVWHAAWWRHYGVGGRIHLFALWLGDRLVGLAPLMRRSIYLHGLPAQAIGFLENSQSLHNDFLVLPQWRELFFQELTKTLFRRGAGWNVLLLRHLPAGSADCRIWGEILRGAGKKFFRQPTWADSPYLVPTGSWADYLAGRTSRVRKNLRNIQNRMHKAGQVSLDHICTWDAFQAAKEEIFALARRSWTGTVGDSMGSPANEPFFETLACQTAARGWLSVWTLHLDGRMIAAEFHLQGYGKEHALRGHYDPAAADLSPGTYLEAAILRSAFEEGGRVERYDFCGGFEDYKKKWTEAFAPMATWSFSMTTSTRGCSGPTRPVSLPG